MSNEIKAAPDVATAGTDSAREFDRRRREALIRLGKAAAYAAPITVAAFSVHATPLSG